MSLKKVPVAFPAPFHKSQQCLHTSDPLQIVRDPAKPPALSIDEQIKLGPVVMNLETRLSWRGFRISNFN